MAAKLYFLTIFIEYQKNLILFEDNEFMSEILTLILKASSINRILYLFAKKFNTKKVSAGEC